MPYINIRTTKKMTEAEVLSVKAECGKAIALFPGKSESWLMVDISSNEDMFFKGIKGDCAFVEVKIFGDVSPASAEKFTAGMCRIMSNVGIPADRTYVRYEGGTSWGWNGSNF